MDKSSQKFKPAVVVLTTMIVVAAIAGFYFYEDEPTQQYKQWVVDAVLADVHLFEDNENTTAFVDGVVDESIYWKRLNSFNQFIDDTLATAGPNGEKATARVQLLREWLENPVGEPDGVKEFFSTEGD